MSIASYWIYIRIYKHVPPGLKRSATINLIGAFIVSFLYVTTNILESVAPGLFPPISRVFEAGGALTQALIFARHEQLFYILPFKTQRLLVLDSDTGTVKFSHDWSKIKSLIGNDILSGILRGMNLIIGESVGKGKVTEFKMDRGVLLAFHDISRRLTMVLISSRPVKVLSQGLMLFARRYIEESERSKEQDSPSLIETTSLVHECFPFVPQY